MSDDNIARFRHDIHLHEEHGGRVTDMLGRILTRLGVLEAQGERLVMAGAELKAGMKRIDAATTNIAADLKRLKDKVGTGMTDAEVADVQAAIDAQATRLEGMANDPDNPDPPVEVPPATGNQTTERT